MTDALDIAPCDADLVRALLSATAPRPCRVWVFGSRARGTARRTSDLDLAIDAGRPLTLTERAELGEGFTESALPWRVDVVDLATASEAFREIVRREAADFLTL